MTTRKRTRTATIETILPTPEVSADDLAASLFLKKYKEIIKPNVEYKSYFMNSNLSVGAIFNNVKSLFKTKVLSGDWTERKYVAIINQVFESEMVLNLKTIDSFSKLYDKGYFDGSAARLMRAHSSNDTRRIVR